MVVIASVLLMLAGCSHAAKTATVDEMVGVIIKHADDGDKGFFSQYMDTEFKGHADKLIVMIKASGMADNYKTRLVDVSDAKARLNYHYLEKGCHFQINLERHDGSWIIRRIWFCR
jgi:5-formaminoimidazole-4-carboxamide-1-beta-D-ribofuranosyl 5'-monophosphate synthetase